MNGVKARSYFVAGLLILSVWASTNAAFAAVKVALGVKPDPPGVGDHTLLISVTDAAGKPVDGSILSLQLFMPAMGTMPRMEGKTTVIAKGGGAYQAVFDLPMGGTWELVLTIDNKENKEVLRYSVTTGIPGVASKGSGGNVSVGEQPTNLMDLGPGRLQQIGVRFAEAKVVTMTRTVEAVGVVEQDQTKREELTLRFPGYIVKQFRGRLGDSVKVGDPLFTVYSPDLVTAQSELLLADKISGDGRSLHQAAGEKLKNLGLSAKDVAQIRSNGKSLRDVVIRARVAGTILEVNAREGAAVTAGQVIYVIGDLSKSYIVARVFQQDVGDLKVGQNAEITLPGSTNQAHQGKIDLIYPQVEQGAGTTNVRVVATEYTAGLRPGVYVDLKFMVGLGELLAIPTEAALYSGRHRYVFVDRGDGVLEPREIDVGKTAGELVEVKAGLKQGDRIVASGTFLLGSEAQLRSALPKWKNHRADHRSDAPTVKAPSPAANYPVTSPVTIGRDQ